MKPHMTHDTQRCIKCALMFDQFGLPALTICYHIKPFCMAESVAIEHTTMAMYFNSKKDMAKGNRKSSSPVALFIIVCRDINCFLETYPHIILLILIIAIAPPHIHNH